MKEEEKENFVKQWEMHITEINILGMNPDEGLSKRVFELVKELKSLIPKIADAKISV